MGNETGQDPVTEDLQSENENLRRQLFVAESVIAEYRQALADAQFALAKSNAQLKYATQPTA